MAGHQAVAAVMRSRARGAAKACARKDQGAVYAGAAAASQQECGWIVRSC